VDTDDSITVETDLFEHWKVGAHFINRCCFGEDFAAWLRQELASRVGPEFELSDVIQEDYGWGFWVSGDHDRFWIALSYVGDGPQKGPVQWVISVKDEPNISRRLLRHRNIDGLG
jgi:hypothetical protein